MGIGCEWEGVASTGSSERAWSQRDLRGRKLSVTL